MSVRRVLKPSKLEWRKRLLKHSPFKRKIINIRVVVKQVERGKIMPQHFYEEWAKLRAEKLKLERQIMAAIEYTELDKLHMWDMLRCWYQCEWVTTWCADIYQSGMKFVEEVIATDRIATREDKVEVSETLFALLSPDQRRRLKKAYDFITEGDERVIVRMSIAHQETVLDRTNLTDEERKNVSASLSANLQFLREMENSC